MSVCVDFVMCGRFCTMCTCVYCVLYFLYCVFVLFLLCLLILICLGCTSARTTASKWKFNFNKLLLLLLLLLLILILLLLLLLLLLILSFHLGLRLLSYLLTSKLKSCPNNLCFSSYLQLYLFLRIKTNMNPQTAVP